MFGNTNDGVNENEGKKQSVEGKQRAGEYQADGNALKFRADPAGTIRSTAEKHDTNVIRVPLLINTQHSGARHLPS